MNSYKFILENYHAIKNAEIIINGLTVLAGLNGSGKSTISRWLYGFVRFSNAYDLLVDNETAASIYDRNRRLAEVQRRIAFWTKSDVLPRMPNLNFNLEYEVAAFQERIHGVYDSIVNNLSVDLIGKYGKELWNSLGIKTDGKDITECLDSFVENENAFLTITTEEGAKRKRECSIADLYRIIKTGLDINCKGPLNMQLTENGTDLLDHDFEYIVDEDGNRLYDGNDGNFIVTERLLGRFLAPMGLKRAIYIDSPMAITNKSSFSNRLWNDFVKMLYHPLKPMTPKALRITREINLILEGDIFINKEGLTEEIRYKRKSDGLNISIDEIATGMKTFAYILQLLQNGYIDSETLLIIDEPEAHLHPQWIVKFAKVLVLIQKLIGAKIMVASHDPDMVAAINAIAEVEGLSEVTNFYQAVKDPGDPRYLYINSGNDISRIFESFNIALDRIDGYKSVDIS